MKKLTRFIALSLVCAFSCFAQSGNSSERSRPDMSGVWVLDNSKDRTGSATPNAKMVVTHRDPEFKIMRTVDVGGRVEEYEQIFYTDGRGETNVGQTITDRLNAASAKEVIKSKTRWRKDKIETRAYVRKILSGRPLGAEMTDTWRASPDGETIIRTSLTRLDAQSGVVVEGGAREFKTVYRRAAP